MLKIKKYSAHRENFGRSSEIKPTVITLSTALRFAIVALLLLMMSGVASATTYYVNNSWGGASDSNDGLDDTNTSAWLTIGKCASTLVGGDTCSVKAGTYSETVSLVDKNGTTSWINFVGSGLPLVSGVSNAFSITNVSYYNFTGFNTTASDPNAGFYIEASDHINVVNSKGYAAKYAVIIREHTSYSPKESSFVTVDNFEAWGTAWSAITVNYGNQPITGDAVNNITIKNSNIHDVSAHNGIDIHTSIKDVVVENNTLNNITGSQTAIYVHNWEIENATIRNNTISNSDKGIAMIGTNNSTVIGNNITNTKYNAIYMQTDNDSTYGKNLSNLNLIIKNNIVDTITTAGYGAINFQKVAGTSINSNITLNNNTIINASDGGDIQFETSANYNIIIRDENPEGQTITIRKYTNTDLSGASLEYINGRIFTENDASNIPYWYGDKSNISISGESGTETYTIHNSTLNTTGNITITSFSSSAMTMDFYNQSVSRANFTLSTLDSVSLFNITILNAVSGDTYKLRYHGNSTVIDTKTASSTIYFNDSIGVDSYDIILSTNCNGFNDSTTIYTGNCSTLADLETAVNDISILNGSILNTNLTVNASQTFNIGDSEWLKGNSTDKTGANALWLKVLGTLHVNATGKITSWNISTGTDEDYPNTACNALGTSCTVANVANNGRFNVYTSGSGIILTESGANLSNLGNWCNGQFGGTTTCGGINIGGGEASNINGATLIDNYIIMIQQTAANTTINNSNITSRYGGIWTNRGYINILNNTVTWSPQSSYNHANFQAIKLTGSDNSNVSYNNINQTTTVANAGGIRLDTTADNNVLLNNTVNSNGFSTWYCSGCSNNTLKNNIFTKKATLTQAPVQLELGTQNYNIFDNVTVNTSVNVRGFVLNGNHNVIKNSYINNSYSGASAALQFASGDNNSVINSTLLNANSRDLEIDATSGTFYVVDIFPTDVGVDTAGARLNFVNSSNIAIKLQSNYSWHYTANSTLSFLGLNDFGNSNITQYSNISIYATNSTVQVNDAGGANFTVTNNEATVSQVTYRNVTNSLYYNLRNTTTIKTAQASSDSVSFNSLSIADGVYTISQDTLAPASTTNIQNTTNNFWHNWTWVNPTDSDFNHTMIYINGTFVTNTSNQFYNLTANAHNTSTLNTHTVDTAGNVNTTWVNLTSVIPNNPPILSSIGNKVVDENQWLNFTLSATDTDSDIISYLTNATKGVLNSVSGLFSWLVSYTDSGIYSWFFNATDVWGGEDNETISITVNNVPLSITSKTPSSDPSSSQGTIQNFTVNINRTANVTWLINGTSMQTNNSVTSATYINSTAPVLSSYNVTASVTDSTDTISAMWNWTVTTSPTSNTTPSITNIVNGTVSATSGLINFTVNQSNALTHVKYSNYSNMNSSSQTVNDTSSADRSVNITGLNNNTSYYYSVYAFNASNTSLWTNSTVQNFTTVNNATVPSSGTSGPENINSTVTRYTIYWQWLNPTEASYNTTRIYINGEFITNQTATNYLLQNLQPQSVHTLSLRSVNTTGENSTWVNSTATTLTPDTGGGSGGGGGGGAYIYTPKETNETNISNPIAAQTEIIAKQQPQVQLSDVSKRQLLFGSAIALLLFSIYIFIKPRR